MPANTTLPQVALAHFAATLAYDGIPAPVLRHCEDLFLDWFGSVLACIGARPVEALARFFEAQGPADGPSEFLIRRRGASPLVATAINAAASHFAEQDDVHNGSVFHTAADGFTDADRILDGSQGMAAGVSCDAAVSRLTDGLGTRWTLAETSFRFHASCRQTYPAQDALQQVMRAHRLTARRITKVEARVHKGAIDVLGPVVDPQTVHQAKFSMETVLGLIAVHDDAGLARFDAALADEEVARMRDLMTMEHDDEVDPAYQAHWIGKAKVFTADGRHLTGRVDEPKGDPGNALSRPELEGNARRLAAYGAGASADEMDAVVRRVWSLAEAPFVPRFLS